MTRITIILEGIYKDHGETLRRSAQDTEQLWEILSAFGFERADLKTLSFNVDPEYESYVEDETFKRRLAGYKFRHIMKIEFESNNDRLGKVLYALANGSLNPEIKISYTVKDQEAAKNELLGKAVKDAREKVIVLTRAAGVTIKEIQSIDYSWRKVDLEVSPMIRAMETENRWMALSDDEDSYDLNIEPDDIEVSDTVTVVWEIA